MIELIETAIKVWAKQNKIPNAINNLWDIKFIKEDRLVKAERKTSIVCFLKSPVLGKKYHFIFK